MKKIIFAAFFAALTLNLHAQIQGQRLYNESKSNINMLIGAEEASQMVKAPKRSEDPGVGTPIDYMVQFDFYFMKAFYRYTSYAAQVQYDPDGTTVYIDGLFPGYPKAGWIKGTIDGDQITFSTESCCQYNYRGTLLDGVPYELVYAEDGTYTLEPLVLKIDGDKIYIEDDVDAPQRYMALEGIAEDGTDWGSLTIEKCWIAEPCPFEVKPVEVPETAEPADYIYSFIDADGNYCVDRSELWVDGDDVYMNNLSSSYIVKGTRDGNTVSFPRQFLGTNHIYYFFSGYTQDENGENHRVDYTMTYDPETDAYTPTDENMFAGTTNYFDMFSSYRTNVKAKPYLGDSPMVPSDPHDLYIEDYWEDYEQYYLFYTIDNISADGEYLNPEKMYYYIYLDDEPYTLLKDNYWYIDDDEMTLIPYEYYDSEGGYDIAPGGVAMFEDLFETFGIQSVYIVDGVANYSKVISVDLEGNTYETEAPQTDGIHNANMETNGTVSIYDINGRRLQGLQHGVNVLRINGKDGSMKTVKIMQK